MDLTPVTSSSIEAIGHDPEKFELHVKFRSGATHVYSAVSVENHAAFLGAESIGSHFHKHIRGKDQRKLEGDNA